MQANLGEPASARRRIGRRARRTRRPLQFRNARTPAAPSRTVFSTLCSAIRRQTGRRADRPAEPDPNANPDQLPADGDGKEAHAGSKAVCVRSCDGSFFPVSYSAGGGRLDELQDMCRALCPNADVSLYTYSPSADIQTGGLDQRRALHGFAERAQISQERSTIPVRAEGADRAGPMRWPAPSRDSAAWARPTSW